MIQIYIRIIFERIVKNVFVLNASFNSKSFNYKIKIINAAFHTVLFLIIYFFKYAF